MDNRKKNNIIYLWMGALLLVAILSVILYIFHDVGPNPDFVLPRRRMRALSMVAVAIAVSYGTILFQTMTTMKIFTPSIIGFDALYMFIQSVLVFFAATGSYFITGIPNFLLSVGIMMAFSFVIYALIFRKGSKNIHFLLLTGMIMGTVFGSLTTFIQMIIDPDEFAILQNRNFINFNSINEPLIYIAVVIIIIAIILSLPWFKYLDVMSLGREIATSLGANHNKLSKFFLIVVAMLTSASTALVGPATFLGLIVTNLTYELTRSYKHKHLVPIAVLLSISVVVLGQFLVSRVFGLRTNLSVIINFVGGLYFIYLLLNRKGSQA